MPDPQDLKKLTLLTAEEMTKELKQIASQIIERAPESRPLAIVGIETRGVPLARRLLAEIEKKRANVLSGTLDISLYRDDLDNLGTIPAIKGSDLPFDPEGCHVVLIDDVLFTGRTIHAAIDALMDYGRPACIELGVLVDRKNRELPIAPRYCGVEVNTTRDDYVSVRLEESDPNDLEGAFLLTPDRST